MEELIEAERQFAEMKLFPRKRLKSRLKKILPGGNSLDQSALRKLNKFVDYIARNDLVTAVKWLL